MSNSVYANVANKKYTYSQTYPIIPSFDEEDKTKKDKTVPDTNYFVQTSYSHYYDWLQQQETTIISSTLTTTHSLQLTNKHLIVQQPYKKLHYPLHNVNKINLVFKRMLLPLISGGISAPLFAVALWNHLLHFWFGIGIIMAGVSLLYYGWLGTHQVSIDTNENQIHYFADEKTTELESLVTETNKAIQQRKSI
jgi:hypothetical protein